MQSFRRSFSKFSESYFNTSSNFSLIEFISLNNDKQNKKKCWKLLQLHTTTTNAKKARTQNCHYVSSYPVSPVHITTTIHDALTLIQINIHLLPAGTSIDYTQVHEPGDCAPLPPPPSTPRPSCYSAMYRSTEGSGGRQRRRLLPS